MRIKELTAILEQIAPSNWARLNDEPVWQGATRDNVERLAVCVDTTEENLRQAVALGVDTIVSHHGWDGTLPELVYEYGLAIRKCHTNWDRAPEGNSVILARRLGLTNIEGFNYSAVGDCQAKTVADLMVKAGQVAGRKVLPYVGDPQRSVTRVGVMAGACFGANFEDEWAELLRRGCEIVLSGDLSQRVARAFASRGVAAVDIGHSSSEAPGMEHLAGLLEKRLPIPVLFLPDYYRLDVAFI